MQCPECGHDNIAGSLFCERCGADLEPAALPPGALPPTALPAQPDSVSPPPPPVAASPEAAPLVPPAVPAPPEPAPPVPAPEPRVACVHCGHGNPADYLRCEACGQPLREAAPEPPPPPAVVPASLPADDLPQRRLETPDALEQAGATPAAPPGAPTHATGTTAAGTTPGQLVTGPQRGKVKLIVEQGMVLGKQFLLANEQVLVGREDASERLFPDIDLTGLDEGYVHRKHAMLTFEGSFLFVTHLGGHNRTYVNNRPIADHLPHPLNIGDTVRFGKVVLRVVEV